MKDKIKLSIFWVISFFIIIFIFCFRVHAEELYFPMTQDSNGVIDPWIIEYAETTYLSDDNDIIIKGPNYISGYEQYFIAVCPRNQDTHLYGELNNNGYQFNLYQIGNANVVYREVKIQKPQYWYWDNDDSSHYYSWHNCDSSLYNSSIGYVSNFILYNTNNENHVIVLKYGSGNDPVIDIGVAIIPPEPIIPYYPSGTTPPAQVPPTFTSSDYNWTIPPTFDNSSVTSAIGSIQNTLGWIANNLKEEFKNLTNNLKGFFKYIGDTIQYYGNSLLSTLNNFIQNFYDNMKALVEPIFQKIDYITTPLEADIIWDNISGTSLITNYSSIINAASSLKSSFENLSEPTEYKIPIHLENISTFGTLTTQYIDLSVINPVKPIIRTFMWALITYSLVVTIIDSIANYINGGGDES